MFCEKQLSTNHTHWAAELQFRSFQKFKMFPVVPYQKFKMIPVCFRVVTYQKFKMFLLVPGLDLLPVNRYNQAPHLVAVLSPVLNVRNGPLGLFVSYFCK